MRDISVEEKVITTIVVVVLIEALIVAAAVAVEAIAANTVTYSLASFYKFVINMGRLTSCQAPRPHYRSPIA